MAIAEWCALRAGIWEVVSTTFLSRWKIADFSTSCWGGLGGPPRVAYLGLLTGMPQFVSYVMGLPSKAGMFFLKGYNQMTQQHRQLALVFGLTAFSAEGAIKFVMAEPALGRVVNELQAQCIGLCQMIAGISPGDWAHMTQAVEWDGPT